MNTSSILSRAQNPHQPMRKATYTRKIKQLKAKHPWLESCHLEPAPGHIALLDELCHQIESIVPTSKAQKFRFFRVTHSFSGMQIYFTNHPLRHERTRAIKHCIDKIIDKSERTCPTCGSQNYMDIDKPSFTQYHCAEHRTSNGLFLEDFERLAAPPEPSKLDKLRAELFPEGIPPIMESEEPAVIEIKPEPTFKPQIQLFDPSEFNHFKSSINNRHKDHQARLHAAVSKITRTGSHARQLQTLPASWKELIADFQQAFPNFTAVTELLQDHFSLSAIGDQRISFPPLLLIGDAGIGKTEAARWLAEHLQIAFKVMDMASAQSNSAIAGSDSFWSNSQEGIIFEMLAYEPYSNPLIVLDEIDKVSADQRFNPLAPLYTLLEPSSAKQFSDLAIKDLAIDASHINWIATANTTKDLPSPILSRFTVLHIPNPNVEQTQHIAQAIYQKLCAESPWGKYFVAELTSDVTHALSQIPPRTLKMILKRALGIAAREGRPIILTEDINATADTKVQGIGFMAHIN